MDEILTEVTETTTIDVPEIQEVGGEIEVPVDSVDQVGEIEVPKPQQPQLGTVVANAVIGSVIGYGMSIILPAMGRAVCKGINAVGEKIEKSKENKKAKKASKVEDEVVEVDVDLDEIEVEVELDEK